jgi:hypothetical protein
VSHLFPEHGTLFKSCPEALGLNRLRWATINLALLLLPLAMALCSVIFFQSHLASVQSTGDLVFSIGYFVLAATFGSIFSGK